MVSEPAQPHASDPPTPDDGEPIDEDETPVLLCHVCQTPIGRDATRIDGGEPAHPDCATKVVRDGPLL